MYLDDLSRVLLSIESEHNDDRPPGEERVPAPEQYRYMLPGKGARAYVEEGRRRRRERRST